MPSLFEMISGGNQDAADQINGLYRGFLNRTPDAAGATYWNNQAVNGMSPAEMAQRFYMSPEAQNVASGTRGIIQPTTQSQRDWRARAEQATQNLNSMPYVLDPSKLTNNPTANRNLMYPASAQPGATTQTIVGGHNVGRDLAGIGADTSAIPPNPTVDSLLALISQQTGKSIDEARTWLQDLIKSNATSSATPAQSAVASASQNLAPDNSNW